jgi:hypothetical protein
MAAGDTVAVTATDNRTLIYSLKTGMQKGRVFGYMRAVSADGSKILVENGKGEVDLYDTSGLESLVHFTFPVSMVHAEFSADGKSIRILTADQVIYNVKTAPSQQSVSVQ